MMASNTKLNINPKPSDIHLPPNPCLPFWKTEKWDVYPVNQYSPKIKITNWWYHREGYPKDFEHQTLSSYKRLGTWKEDKDFWLTETKQAMEEGMGDASLTELKNKSQPRRFLNFLSYPGTLKPRSDLSPDEIRKMLPTLPKDELTIRYTTTNQSHYRKIHILPK